MHYSSSWFAMDGSSYSVNGNDESHAVPVVVVGDNVEETAAPAAAPAVTAHIADVALGAPL